MREKAMRQLQSVYTRFLQDIEKDAHDLMGEDYSNPYFISVPEKWFDAESPRILIVGEEGFGTYGCGKQGGPDEVFGCYCIETIQSLNYLFLRKQLGDDNKEYSYSPFWRRFREIARFGECAWSNIDKIHLLRDRNCRLSNKERKLLHSINTRILHEEISILNPTHIVFFGWYGVSLQHELPVLFEKMYPNGLGDSSVWDRNVVAFEDEGRHYIFAYHPNWGYRNRGYEDKVIATLKECL